MILINFRWLIGVFKFSAAEYKIKKTNIWEPVYKISPKVARALMDIEAAKTIVERTALPPTAEAELRRAARVRSTHFSTRVGT